MARCWAAGAERCRLAVFHFNDKPYPMRTLNISISDLEFDKFGIKTEQLSFTDFVDMVSRELSRQALNSCVALAERHGLSRMTMEEISAEVTAVRNAANS